ncbi:thiamine ABC transporter ATP-binding protein ThiQ [Xenorhabdus sp. Flor]|uniref:thiamine ABC transporter ATP-binding protein ThiQ n=1 Tax=Xenorhabdus cabanillasii TaxID=351673 RepID=UPI0019B30C2D|nr:thiamine ABC transporter ATP-binding protein ThiQ [Xenorhabdus sp. Flor]MBD2814723.1 thiamine ABC transporter ATP-binding protein ThiQ [Xenorhabdus sp. Flor]
MIKLENVTYIYEQNTHEQITMRFDINVEAGERIAILGPSGAGKSTLLSLMAGFQFAKSGDIWLDKENHTNTAPSKRPVSMLFQENNLFSHLTIEQNIGLGLHPGLKLNAQQRQTLQQIASQVSLTEYLHRLPAQLSGGQRQRAALARCLVRQQPILLLDEPFSALDPALRNEMLELLDQVCRDRKLTLLMVSHNLDDAAKIAPRSLLIVDGTIRYDGATEKLVNGEVPEARILGIG